jgi:hypothetical protein
MKNVPAILNRHSESGTEQIDLLISTEKIGGVVFLKIDQVGDTQSD